MVRRKLAGLIICGLLLAIAATAMAGIPDLTQCSATSLLPTGTTVSIYNLPSGTGWALTVAKQRTSSVRVNSQITVTIRDSAGAPIWLYPFEDIWLETAAGGMLHCPSGTSADFNTGATGRTTITGPFFASRWSGFGGSAEQTVVIIGGSRLTTAAFDIWWNSPDINGDGAVNLTDTVAYTANAGSGGTYSYRSDYYYDGAINLSDTVLYAQGLGAACP